MRGLIVVAVLMLAGCGVRGLGEPLLVRQGGIVAYLTEPVVRPVAGSDDIRAACDWQLRPSIDRGNARPERGERLNHFGVYYAKFEPLPDGRMTCAFAADWNGGSVADIAPSVAARCNRVQEVSAPCRPVYEIVPRGYEPSLGPTIGGIAAQDLVDQMDAAGYGAVALSSDGAWSVKSGYDTRAGADAAAREGCMSVVSGYPDLSEAQNAQMAQSCTVVFRFGDDAPAQGRVTVIR